MSMSERVTMARLRSKGRNLKLLTNRFEAVVANQGMVVFAENNRVQETYKSETNEQGFVDDSLRKYIYV